MPRIANRTLRTYYVYVLASHTRRLYIGVTNDLKRRLYEHRHVACDGSFTDRYNIRRLVNVEDVDDIEDAIAREKQIKKWRREKKIALVESQNPEWRDLSEGWFEEG